MKTYKYSEVSEIMKVFLAAMHLTHMNMGDELGKCEDQSPGCRCDACSKSAVAIKVTMLMCLAAKPETAAKFYETFMVEFGAAIDQIRAERGGD
ncbi:MAG: hypothetical protein ACXABY_20145 [Candidatus Thorarchaeota archaeon]|jgi:hypothetical protein